MPSSSGRPAAGVGRADHGASSDVNGPVCVVTRRPASDASRSVCVVTRHGLGLERPVLVHYCTKPMEARLSGDLHVAFEIGVVFKGWIERDHGGGWFRVGTGQAYASAPFQPHRSRLGSSKHARLVFLFLPQLFEQMPNLEGFDPRAPFRAGVSAGAIGATRAAKRRLRELGEEMAARYAMGIQYPLPGRGCLDLIRLLDAACQALPADAPEDAARGGALLDAEKLEPALRLVQARPDRPPRVSEAARACRMSATTFSRMFKTATGESFGRFATRWRLARAAHALRATHTPVKAVALQFGFRHASHFYDIFTAHYRMTPGQYRRAARQ